MNNINLSMIIEIYKRRLISLNPDSQAYKWGLHQLKQFKLQAKRLKNNAY